MTGIDHASAVAGAFFFRLLRDISLPVVCDFDEQENRLRARADLVKKKAGLHGPLSCCARTVWEIKVATGLDLTPDGGAEAEALEVAPAVINRW